MKTEVTMKRVLFGSEIRQKSQSSFFSATDLVSAGNKWRYENNLSIFNLSQWLKKEGSLEFIKSLEEKYGEVIIKSRGRNSSTWVHPFLFIDMALAISPKLKIEAYEWLYDNLIEYRNKSGDSFKKMSGALWISSTNKSLFQNEISEVSGRIKKECEVEDWNQATEDQLKLRDKIHEYIALFSDIVKNREALLSTAICKAREAS